MNPKQTLLFADLSGFTALTEVHGDEDAFDLADRFGQLVRAQLPPSAALVKMIGDAAMVIGSDEADMVRFSVRLVREVEQLPGKPAVRIGIHAGAVVERSGDYWGHAVNVAARLASIAQPCEILLTAAVRDSIKASDGIAVVARGEHRLKNVSEPLELFAVTHRDSGLHTDPVCRMRLLEAESHGRIEFGGGVYFFCSFECAQSFMAKPGPYVT